MPFAGLTYRVQPGHEEEIAWIFSPENFTRVDSPVLHDEAGTEIGYLTCTGLFIQDDTIVRVIQHDGGALADIRRHMSTQEGVHEAERRLLPYLTQPRDTETAEGFMAHFDRSTMAVLDLAQVDNRPAAGLLALRYPVRPVPAGYLAEAFRSSAPHLELGGPVVARLLLAKDDTVIRVVQYEGCTADEVIEHLAGQPAAAATDAWLTPFRSTPSTFDGDAAAHLVRHRMRCLSHLSAAVTG